MSPVRQPRLKARVALERDDRILCVLHAKAEPFWCLPGGNVDPGDSCIGLITPSDRGHGMFVLIESSAPGTPTSRSRRRGAVSLR
mgnify:CR=1 FL=1